MNIINSEEFVLLPDYTLDEKILHNSFNESDMLALSKHAGQRLDRLGLEIYKIFSTTTDKAHERVRYSIFNHNGLYGMKKDDWTNFLESDKGIFYLRARLVISNAASKVVNNDLSHVDEGFTIDFINDNSDERLALKEFFSVKTTPTDENIKGYLLDLVDEFTLRISGNYLKQYGWDNNDVKRAIISHIDNHALKVYVDELDVANNGLIIKSQVEDLPEWSTKILPSDVRNAAQWLILNSFENEEDVKNAFYFRQTSAMSDDRYAEENDNAAIVRVYKKYHDMQM